MGGASTLSELTVGLSDGSCRTVGETPVGAVTTVGSLSGFCHNPLSDCRTGAQVPSDCHICRCISKTATIVPELQIYFWLWRADGTFLEIWTNRSSIRALQMVQRDSAVGPATKTENGATSAPRPCQRTPKIRIL